MRILHIHQDYPDGRGFPFTRAVENLINASSDENPDIDHYVLSINRTNNPFKISFKIFDRGLSVVYWAFPLPFIYAPAIYFWSLIACFLLRNERFDVVHGHKLTTEGLWAYFVARKFNLKFCLSVRGGSDCRNLKRLWDLKRIFRKIYKKSVHVFWVSPWAKSEVEKLLCYEKSSYSFFPNICHIENIKNTFLNGKRVRYCTVVSLHQMKRKGLFPLLEAITLLRDDGVFIELDIIGGGDYKYFDEVKEKVNSLNIEQQVRVLGALTHDDLLKNISKAKGLLLPAINETFGMAYIEAIASGTPVLFMSDTGIDGHFEAKKIGVRIDSQDPETIKNGIIFLEENHEKLLKYIFFITESNDLQRFTGPFLGRLYINCLEHFFYD